MNILLTNDDGINGEGLIVLKEALEKIEGVNLNVIAPDRERSACSHSITVFEPLILKEVDHQTYTLNGSPADCVKIALDGFLKNQIDLVLSGINNGPNMGIDVYYSGTAAGAREAVFHSVPGVAFSIDGYTHEKQFESACHYALKVIDQVRQNKLTEGVYLNVNFPNIPKEKVNGFEITCLGKRVYQDQVIERETPFGSKYFWIGGELPAYHFKENSDFMAVENQKVSITPLQLDVTCYSTKKILKEWNFDI